METTDEEAEGQQDIAGMRSRFTNGFAPGLFWASKINLWRSAQTDYDEWQNCHYECDDGESLTPAQDIDEFLRARHEKEHAERGGGDDGAEDQTAMFIGHNLANCAQDQDLSGTAQSQANQQAEREEQIYRCCAEACPPEAEGVEDGTGDDDSN